MALERQVTFKTNITKPIDVEVENYLKNNEIDPAAVQVIIDNAGSAKILHLIYAERSALKEVYQKQGRTYSDLDAVTYCHTKDIFVNRGENIDKEVNNFLSNENISVISISNYVTQLSEGAFILYIDLPEQKQKMEAKQEEVAKMQEEIAHKLASEAVKNADLETNETVEKFAEISKQLEQNNEELNTLENSQDVTITSGYSQVINEEEKLENTVSSTTTTSIVDEKVDTKKKLFGRR